MRMTYRSVAVAVGFLALQAAGVCAEDKPAAAPAMDPAKQAQMEALQKLGSPNENHQVFEPLVGKWTYTLQWWMAPEAPADSMSGTTENTLLFNGRFLTQKVKGESKDFPGFEGLLLLGYDNVRQEYQSVWLDNMATGLMTGSGGYDAAAKTITQAGEFGCPMTGETHRYFRSAWHITDADHNTYTSYSKTPEGREFKSMEILYTRVP